MNGSSSTIKTLGQLHRGLIIRLILVSVNGASTYTGYWMGRIAVSANGGIIGFYNDCSGQNDYYAQIFLYNFWDLTGGNFIQVSSWDGHDYGGTCYYKIYG